MSASPRLQHAVRLLQMSSLDFVQALRDAVDLNPLLELEEAEARVAPVEREPVGGIAEWAGASSGAPSPDDRSDAAPAWDHAMAPPSLRAHLHAQLDYLRLPDRPMVLARAAVESLDDDGYLRGGAADIEEIVGVLGLTPAAQPAEIEAAWARLRSLDPCGVGATDLRDCLRLQIPQIADADLRPLAARIVEHHLTLVPVRDPGRMASVLKVSPQAAAAACAEIRKLDPAPGRRFHADAAVVALPEVVAVRTGSRWGAALNDAAVPRLRVHPDYGRIVERKSADVGKPLSAALQEARWLVGNVSQRFATIHAVANAICRQQQGFFEYGPLALKPLGLRQIAEEVGVHESTVSRVTNNKYIATRFGVHELTYFFSRGLETRSGNACAPAAVRELVAELIAAEEIEHRLSDGEVAGLLAEQGFSVARRTVTKYRQALRIPQAEARRAQ